MSARCKRASLPIVKYSIQKLFSLFPVPLYGKSLCCWAVSNKSNRTNKPLQRCRSRQLRRREFFIGTVAIVLSILPSFLVGLVTSYFASITVLCVLPKTKEV